MVSMSISRLGIEHIIAIVFGLTELVIASYAIRQNRRRGCEWRQSGGLEVIDLEQARFERYVLMEWQFGSRNQFGSRDDEDWEWKTVERALTRVNMCDEWRMATK